MLTVRNYLHVALYHQFPSFSLVKDFLDVIAPESLTAPYTREAARSLVAELLDPSWPNSSASASEKCLRRLVQEDLRRVSATLADDQICSFVDAEADIPSRLQETADWAAARLRQLGVPCSVPRVEVVAAFPKGFEDKDCHAVYLDESDSKDHGTEVGIYFLQRYVRPLYSRYLLLHEIVHHAVGTIDPYLVPGGLEEGLSELVGAVFLSRELLGEDLTEKLFVYNRLAPHLNPPLSLYAAYFRQAVCLFYAAGWRGVFETLRGGRQAIQACERRLWSGEEVSQSPQSQQEDGRPLIDRLALVYPANNFCSPLARFIAPLTERGRPLSEIAQLADIPEASVREGVKELYNCANMASLAHDQKAVSFSDARRLYSPLVLRYIAKA